MVFTNFQYMITDGHKEARTVTKQNAFIG